MDKIHVLKADNYIAVEATVNAGKSFYILSSQ